MKTYRIKSPRCWVLRWYEAGGCDPSTDYVGKLSLASKAGATEYSSPDEARADVERVGLDWDVWRIVRRGKVTK